MIKTICSAEEKLNNRLEQLNQWLVNRGYKENHVDSEIESVKLVGRQKIDDSVALGLTYHLPLNKAYEILRRALKHFLKSPGLHSALPSPPRVAFEFQKQLETNQYVLS